MIKKILVMMWLFSFMASAYGQQCVYDVHVGLNTSGFTGSNSQTLYGESNKMGMNIGLGVSYAFRSHMEIMSGLDFVLTGGQFGVMSNYIGTDGLQTVLFPEVNVRHVSIEIPAMIGFRTEVGRHFQITPMAGFYGRCGLLSIKDKVYAADGRSPEKWDCYQSYRYDGGSLSAVKRLDFGVAAALRLICFDHYEMTFSYHRGLINQLPDYGAKFQLLSLMVGYRF